MRILVVDDNQASLDGLLTVLTDLGHDPDGETDPMAALQRAGREVYPLVITDIRMPGLNGLDLLSRLKAEGGASRLADVVLVTGYGDMDTAVEAVRRGAYDYLSKPVNARELEAVVERSAEHQTLLHENRDFRQGFERKLARETEALREDLDRARNSLLHVAGIGRIISASEAFDQVLDKAGRYHEDPTLPVLIEGETGTGKEIIAKLIHYGSGEVTSPFVDINCAAVSAQLFESEFFGYEEGAFTGSLAGGRRGKLETAGDGTVFLDEIGEMPLELQPKLLRALQDRTFYRVGGVTRRSFAARIICATNQNLADMVEAGSFRRDLYHRLTVGYIRIPPLRDRPEAILPLADFFLEQIARRKDAPARTLSEEAASLLRHHSWPGNVRELENTIERAVLSTASQELHADDIQLQAGTEQTQPAPGAGIASQALAGQADLDLPPDGLDLEKLNLDIIRAVLDHFDGNKTQAAKYLGMSRFALHRRLESS